MKTKVLVGHSGRRILRYIENHDISLVVMGTHGRSGLGTVFFGSVAQRVVQSAKVPVLTVHPAR
jgi:nucleotide-binding universal stress UspA family protein